MKEEVDFLTLVPQVGKAYKVVSPGIQLPHLPAISFQGEWDMEIRKPVTSSQLVAACVQSAVLEMAAVPDEDQEEDRFLLDITLAVIDSLPAWKCFELEGE